MSECHVPVFEMPLTIKGVRWEVALICHFPLRQTLDWRPSIIEGSLWVSEALSKSPARQAPNESQFCNKAVSSPPWRRGKENQD